MSASDDRRDELDRDQHDRDQHDGAMPGHPAIAVETYVEHERGRWVVEIVVIFADSVVRHRVGDHATRRQAEIAAGWIKRGASRPLRAPLKG